ncbi:hypothetical protein LTR97_004232 [Elasticomyces elasticus]|uniref:AB hydrolase-1 domain-containing protein n=1 Tax=Elasticomyces elasticus TaxID=574655 RepID=A0AAN7W906_9PEZI|nr:hypothetical protein LTR97_004232 [Elasticomyces elasticus]
MSQPAPASRRKVNVPFSPPGTSKNCETAVWIYGDIHAHVPLIAVHGGPGSPSPYFTPLGQLTEKHGVPVMLYDQLGCGDSTHLPDTSGDIDFWTIGLFLAELSNTIAHFGIKEYDLLGHSWGGLLAGEFALTQPKGLRKLIIYSSPASYPKRVGSGLALLAALPAEFRKPLEKGDIDEQFKNTKEYQAAMMYYNRTHMCRMEPWPQPFLDSMTLMSQDETVCSTLYQGGPFQTKGHMKDWDITDRLPEITKATVPGGILLMNGKYDFVNDDSVAAWSTEVKADVKWVRFDESSHMAHLEEPEKFLAVVGDFLTAHKDKHIH